MWKTAGLKAALTATERLAIAVAPQTKPSVSVDPSTRVLVRGLRALRAVVSLTISWSLLLMTGAEVAPCVR